MSGKYIRGERMKDIPTVSQLEELKLMTCAKAGKNLLRHRLSDTDTICDYCECAIYDCKDDSICAIQNCIDLVKKVRA